MALGKGRLFALADLHVSYKFNLEAVVEFFESLPSKSDTTATTTTTTTFNSTESTSASHGNTSTRRQLAPNFTHDGLILAGDVSEKLGQLRRIFDLTTRKFKRVWWVPGNHELYTLPGQPRTPSPLRTGSYGDFDTEKEDTSGWSRRQAEEAKRRETVLDYELKGEAKYLEIVRIAGEYGVLTPEDEYTRWEYEVEDDTNVNANVNMNLPAEATTTLKEEGKNWAKKAALICPIFTLYDYTFRPSHLNNTEEALSWAMEQNIRATDEILLHPDPYPSREAWCSSLVNQTRSKLTTAKLQYPHLPFVLINHWPLRQDLVHIPLVPRFVLWCGTKETENWHQWFNAQVVVSGHLHVRRTDWKDGTRFEEVSLGYPKQWEAIRLMGRGVGDVLREILPAKGWESPPSSSPPSFQPSSSSSSYENNNDNEQPRTQSRPRTVWRVNG